MIRFKPSRLTVVVTLSAILIVMAGSGVVASNMGFKMNKAFFGRAANKGVPTGDNWISLPYNRPYKTYADLCAGLGLPSFTTTIYQDIPETGSNQSCVCGSGTACAHLDLGLDNGSVGGAV